MRRTTAVLAALVVVLVAGCGEDDGDEDTSAETTTTAAAGAEDGGDGGEEGSGSVAGTYVGPQTIQSIDQAPDALPVSGQDVGNSIPISFDVSGPCTDGAECELTFTHLPEPGPTMPLDVSGSSATGDVSWTRTNGQCSWTEEWSMELSVDGDRATGTVTYEPESLAIECDGGRARPVGGTATFEASRS